MRGAPGRGSGIGQAIDVAMVLVPAVMWCGFLLRWLKRNPTMSAVAHKSGMYHALQLWAFTNIVVLAAIFI